MAMMALKSSDYALIFMGPSKVMSSCIMICQGNIKYAFEPASLDSLNTDKK